MHPNPVFRKVAKQANLQFASQNGFGVLAMADEDLMPLMSHIPFLIEEDHVVFHLVRSNPMARLLSSPRPAKLAVQGPHSYLSPDWYGIDDQVPTWNYVAVQLSGQAELLPAEALRGVIDRLSAHFEAMLAPKPAWTSDKTDPQMMTRLMRMIVPARMRITDVEGTWKLAQHKPDTARLAAAQGIADAKIGCDTDKIAALMRDLPVGAAD